MCKINKKIPRLQIFSFFYRKQNHTENVIAAFTQNIAKGGEKQIHKFVITPASY